MNSKQYKKIQKAPVRNSLDGHLVKTKHKNVTFCDTMNCTSYLYLTHIFVQVPDFCDYNIEVDLAFWTFLSGGKTDKTVLPDLLKISTLIQN